jgi:hypothetical protein
MARIIAKSNPLSSAQFPVFTKLYGESEDAMPK